jgi:hypothetical protein
VETAATPGDNDLDPAQKRAVEEINSLNSTSLIRGPPGTGKTYFITKSSQVGALTDGLNWNIFLSLDLGRSTSESNRATGSACCTPSAGCLRSELRSTGYYPAPTHASVPSHRPSGKILRKGTTPDKMADRRFPKIKNVQSPQSSTAQNTVVSLLS